MEDKKVLKDKELEKVSGGVDIDENTIKTDDGIHGGVIYAELQSTDQDQVKEYEKELWDGHRSR